MTNLKDLLLTRLGTWAARRRRDRVIAGLLQSIYMQADTAMFTVIVEDREGETPEARAVRTALVEHGQRSAALMVIGLMVRNELSARGLLHLIGESPAPTSTATMKRTVPGRPE